MGAWTGTFRANEVRGGTPPPPITATGATAGSPGSFTPAGAVAPANLAGLTSVAASPATAWTTGQHVITADAAHASWNGTAWVAGDAALADEGQQADTPRSDWSVPQLDEWAKAHKKVAKDYPFDANKPEKLAYLKSLES